MRGALKILTMVMLILAVLSGGISVAAADYKANIEKANKYIVEQKYKDALKMLRKAYKSDDKNPEIYRKIAFCFEKLNQYDSAIAYYEGAIVFNPQDIDSYQKIGDIYYNEQDFHEAMSWYERGMDLGRLNPQSYNRLGIIYLRWRELRKSRDYFEKAIEADSSFSSGFYGLGLVYMQAGDSAKAVEYFRKSIELGQLPKAAYFLGVIFHNSGNSDSASIWLEKYLQQEPAGEYSPSAEKLLAKIKGNQQK